MQLRGSSWSWAGLGMIVVSVAAAGCAEGHSATGSDDAAEASPQSTCTSCGASADDEDAGRVLSSDPTCGADEGPRWHFQLYYDTARVATPKRSGVSGDENTPVHIDVTGTLMSVGDGIPSDLATRELSGVATDIRHVRIKVAEHTFTIVTHGIANFGAGLRASSEVELSHHDDTIAYIVAPRGPVTTSLRAQGTLLFQYTYSAYELNAPAGFTVTLGEEYCSAHDRCRSWTGHALEVADTTGTNLSLRPGKSDTLAGYTWFAGSVVDEGARHTPTQEDLAFRCTDSGLNATEYLVVRN
ncbi:MAG TPA: hypothetical protein VFN67_16415 [Polyangiales bacterium]|nr:hypothetical protein [Polyangiales bacterium]